MKIRPETLKGALEKGLKRCYIVFGDEELLVLEAADAIRRAAAEQGFVERKVFEANAKFDWSEVTAASCEMSLFATRQLLDVRLPTGKPGKSGGAVLKELAADVSPDTLLLVTAGKLDKATQNTAWFKALDSAGASVQCWPIRTHELPPFLEQRMQRAGLNPEPAAVHALAARVEGNLLAAQQEIEKLAILHGQTEGEGGRLTEKDVLADVADSARFQIFALLDTMLAGEPTRGVRMVRNLAAEGIAEMLAATLITREVRTLARLKAAFDAGDNLQALYRALNIWRSRQRLFEQTIRRHPAAYWRRCLADCARLDRAIKGLAPDRPWELIESIVVAVSSKRGLGFASAL